MPRPAILLTLLALAGCGGSEAQVVATASDPNQPPEVRVEGLEGGQTVELHAVWKSAVDADEWTSTLQLKADDDGTATAGPELLTTMKPPEGEETYFFPPLERNEVSLTVRSDGETLARGTLVRDFRAATTELTDDNVGLYFEPEQPSGKPVLLIGGSEGGYGGLLNEASALAAAGHPALALAYFAERGLPQALRRIPVETVTRGADWLREATGEREIGLIGLSRGGELALIAAWLDPSLDGDVVALVPSSRIGFAEMGRRQPAWTWEGRPLEPRGPIPVERISADVLAVGAGADALTRSKYFVQEIEQRAAVDAVQYEEAGHLVGQPLPYLPGKPTNIMGGTPEADEKARQDLWPKILAALSD